MSESRGGNERNYPTSEIRGNGREEIPHALKPEARGDGRRSYPTPLSPRPGAAVGRTNPTSKEPWLRGHRRA